MEILSIGSSETAAVVRAGDRAQRARLRARIADLERQLEALQLVRLVDRSDALVAIGCRRADADAQAAREAVGQGRLEHAEASDVAVARRLLEPRTSRDCPPRKQ